MAFVSYPEDGGTPPGRVKADIVARLVDDQGQAVTTTPPRPVDDQMELRISGRDRRLPPLVA